MRPEREAYCRFAHATDLNPRHPLTVDIAGFSMRVGNYQDRMMCVRRSTLREKTVDCGFHLSKSSPAAALLAAL